MTIECFPTACNRMKNKILEDCFYFGVVFILICNIVTLLCCDAASVDESQESQQQSCGDKGNLTCCSPLFSFHGPHTGHSSCTLFTSVARTLLPLCRAVRLVCHWSSVPILGVAANDNKKKVAGGQSKLLHWGDGCGRNGHPSRGSNVGFLSRHFSTAAAHLIKAETQCKGSHICVEQLQEDAPPARTNRSHPEDVGVLVGTSISNREYGAGRQFFFSCIKSESNFSFEWRRRCHQDLKCCCWQSWCNSWSLVSETWLAVLVIIENLSVSQCQNRPVSLIITQKYSVT